MFVANATIMIQPIDAKKARSSANAARRSIKSRKNREGEDFVWKDIQNAIKSGDYKSDIAVYKSNEGYPMLRLANGEFLHEDFIKELKSLKYKVRIVERPNYRFDFLMIEW